MPEIIIDITSSARWGGPVVGIVRVETELALWALANTNARFVVFDPRRQRFRCVRRVWLTRLLDGRASLNTWDLPAADPERPRTLDRLPAPLGAAFRALKIRRRLLSALEQVRLANGALATGAGKVQSWLMSPRHRHRMYMSADTRRDMPSFDTALDEEVAAGPDSIFVCAGLGWLDINSSELIRLKKTSGCRVVTFCHDIIPLQFPHWYKAHDVEAFRSYFHRVFPLADLVVFSAHQIESDARDYCRRHSLQIRKTAVVPLGSDFAVRAGTPEPCPPGVAKGRYILFVSTIEPRKGHDLLYKVWLRLLAEGGDRDCRLVFVGRWGWNTADLKTALLGDPRVRDRILIMSDVPDRTLDALYRNCSFCVYPSVYEGFGLPVVEALSYGKAVIASNGGALKEVVGSFSPTLDPCDSDAWYNKLAQWIADSAERQLYEDRIKADYVPRPWSKTASDFFESSLGLRQL
jgi:glycosyltransferase involved in cell wall biosynthesis